MNIVIVGFGKYGKDLTRQLLKDNHSIVIIENNQKILDEALNQYDVKGTLGNGASIATLKAASINNFDLLVALTPMDEVNILSCLVAKKLGIKHTIARVRNHEYQDQSDFIMSDLDVSLALNSDYITAREIYNIIRYPGASKVESFAKDKVELLEIKVKEDSVFNNLKLSEIKENLGVHLLICAVKRDEEITIPKGDFTILAGDIVYVSASKKELNKSLKKLKFLQNKFNSVMLVGASRVSYNLANMLLEDGFSVKIIDRNQDKCEMFNRLLNGVIMLCADGTNQDFLINEGLKNSALVTLTEIDETNIVLSSAAKALGSPKVITKVSGITLSMVLENLKLDSVVTTMEAFTENCVKFIRQIENKRSSVCENLYLLLGGQVEALEFKVNDDTSYTNIELKDLSMKENNLIAAIIRDKDVIVPTGIDTIKKGDSVVVITKNSNVLDLSEVID